MCMHWIAFFHHFHVAPKFSWMIQKPDFRLAAADRTGGRYVGFRRREHGGGGRLKEARRRN